MTRPSASRSACSVAFWSSSARMRPSSALVAQAAESARGSVMTEVSPTRTEASALTCRLCTSRPAGRQARVTLRLPAGMRATRSTVALPG